MEQSSDAENGKGGTQHQIQAHTYQQQKPQKQ